MIEKIIFQLFIASIYKNTIEALDQLCNCYRKTGLSLGGCQAKKHNEAKDRKKVMPKTQPLCTGAELNLGDRVLGEVEKNSFIVLPGKGGNSGLMPSKLCVPTQGDLVRNFIAMVQGWGCQ